MAKCIYGKYVQLLINYGSASATVSQIACLFVEQNARARDTAFGHQIELIQQKRLKDVFSMMEGRKRRKLSPFARCDQRAIMIFDIFQVKVHQPTVASVKTSLTFV